MFKKLNNFVKRYKISKILIAATLCIWRGTFVGNKFIQHEEYQNNLINE